MTPILFRCFFLYLCKKDYDMENCFENIIGVKGCHNTKVANYWVNDLVGMSNELMDNIADGDQETFYDVFSKAQTNAINSLKSEIKRVMLSNSKRVKFAESVFSSEKARVIKPLEILTFDETKIGVLFTTDYSKYIVSTFNSLVLYPTIETIVKLKVIDYETDIVLKEVEDITLIAGQKNTIQVDYTISTDEHRAILIVLERLNIDPNFSLAKLSPTRFKKAKDRSCEPCTTLNGYGEGTISTIPHELIGLDQNDEFAMYPFVSDELIDVSEFTSIDDYISLDVSLICSIESFICQNAKNLAHAVTNKIGANILGAKLGGFKINNMAKGNLEYTKILKDEFEKQYTKELDIVVPNLPMDEVSMCWACDSSSGVWTGSMV